MLASIQHPPEVAPRTTADAVRLVEHRDAARTAIEHFISRRFREAYAAEVHHFMPRLFGLHQADDQLVAAFGLRDAGRERLFLEQYLDAPVEALISNAFDVDAPRAQIVEVGNLAGATPGALRRLIPALTAHLHGAGYRWIAFTGAAHLCAGFTRLGLPLCVAAPARPERLTPEERALWGRYYDRNPSVMLGDVKQGYRTLQRLARNPQALQTQLAPVARVGAP